MPKHQQKSQRLPQQQQLFYQVECILNKRTVKGNVEYLVKWKGYRQQQATWEGANNLTNIIEMILQYEDNHQKIETQSNCKSNFLNLDQPNTEIVLTNDLESNINIDQNIGSNQSGEDKKIKEPQILKSSQEEIESNFEKSDLISTFSYNNRTSSKKVANKLQLSTFPIDFSFEAKKMSAGFQMITEKCKGRGVGKKKQKLYKQLKKTELQSINKREYKRRECKLKNSSIILSQTDQQDFTDNSQYSNMKYSSQPFAQMKSRYISKNQFFSKGDNPNDKNINKDSFLSQDSNPQLCQIITNNYEKSAKQAQREKKNKVIAIRKLESISENSAQYLIQYGNGQLKKMKIIELMTSYPIQFAAYLEQRHHI